MTPSRRKKEQGDEKMMTMESVGERGPEPARVLTPHLAEVHDMIGQAISALDDIVRLVERQGVTLKSVSTCRDGIRFTQGCGSRTAYFLCGIKFVAPSRVNPDATDGVTSVVVAVSYSLMQISESIEPAFLIRTTSWLVEPHLQDRPLAENLNTLASWEERCRWYAKLEIGETPFRADIQTAERLIAALALRTQER